MKNELNRMSFAVRPRALKIVIIIEILSSFFGFWGGIPLIIDPSGSILGLETELIKGIPIINSYLIPGIWLLIVYGFGCGFAAYGLWNFKKWGWNLALIVSIIWIGWVLFELMIWGIGGVKNNLEVLNTTWPWLIPPVLALFFLSRPELRSIKLKKS